MKWNIVNTGRAAGNRREMLDWSRPLRLVPIWYDWFELREPRRLLSDRHSARATAPAFKKLVDSLTIPQRLIDLEADVTYYEPPADGEPPFRYEVGTLPVLISAPHGAAHRRDGRYKQEDEYTAAFARLLAERTGAHAIYTHALSENDPNWDRKSPYKTALAGVVGEHDIRFVIDIHGMSDRHKFGVAVGTMRGASCRQRHEALIVEMLRESEFSPATAAEVREFPELRWDRYVLNHSRFTGGLSSHTVTRFAAEELGVPAAQFELCARLRIVQLAGTSKRYNGYRGDPTGIARAMAAFECMVMALGQ